MSNISSIAQQLNDISGKYEFYNSVVIMIGGLISNLFIILILTHLRIFRGHQCAFYLIIECSANIGLISTILSSRILAHILGIDPVHLSIIWCKIRSWATQVFAFISLFTICSATLDQYLSTNYRYSFRQMSTLKLAYRLIFCIISFAILHNIPLLFLTEIHPITGCSVYNSILNKYYGFFYYPFVVSLLPMIITSSMSLLAYRNVRRIIRLQVPIVRRRLDQQLTAMILARVICLLTLGLPYIIYSISILNISINPNNSIGLAIKQLIGAILLSLFYGNYSINFYIFLIISSRFRHQVKYFLIKKCCHHGRRLQRGVVVPQNIQPVISIVDLD
jgi:hypothetical protein